MFKLNFNSALVKTGVVNCNQIIDPDETAPAAAVLSGFSDMQSD